MVAVVVGGVNAVAVAAVPGAVVAVAVVVDAAGHRVVSLAIPKMIRLS